LLSRILPGLWLSTCLDRPLTCVFRCPSNPFRSIKITDNNHFRMELYEALKRVLARTRKHELMSAMWASGVTVLCYAELPQPINIVTKNDIESVVFRVTTFQLSLSNGARWRLIELNGVIFAVLKYRVLQKRHRPPRDKTSGLSFDTALYPYEYKNLHGNSR
jgi:hypothetical protein